MEGVDRRTALRVEKLRVLLAHNAKILELHQQRLVQAFGVLLGAGAAASGSVLLDRIPPTPGLALAAAMFTGAGYAHLQVRRLPQRLKVSTLQAVEAIDRLMEEDE